MSFRTPASFYIDSNTSNKCEKNISNVQMSDHKVLTLHLDELNQLKNEINRGKDINSSLRHQIAAMEEEKTVMAHEQKDIVNKIEEQNNQLGRENDLLKQFTTSSTKTRKELITLVKIKFQDFAQQIEATQKSNQKQISYLQFRQDQVASLISEQVRAKKESYKKFVELRHWREKKNEFDSKQKQLMTQVSLRDAEKKALKIELESWTELSRIQSENIDGNKRNDQSSLLNKWREKLWQILVKMKNDELTYEKIIKESKIKESTKDVHIEEAMTKISALENLVESQQIQLKVEKENNKINIDKANFGEKKIESLKMDFSKIIKIARKNMENVKLFFHIFEAKIESLCELENVLVLNARTLRELTNRTNIAQYNLINLKINKRLKVFCVTVQTDCLINDENKTKNDLEISLSENSRISSRLKTDAIFYDNKVKSLKQYYDEQIQTRDDIIRKIEKETSTVKNQVNWRETKVIKELEETKQKLSECEKQMSKLSLNVPKVDFAVSQVKDHLRDQLKELEGLHQASMESESKALLQCKAVENKMKRKVEDLQKENQKLEISYQAQIDILLKHMGQSESANISPCEDEMVTRDELMTEIHDLSYLLE